MHNTNYTPKFNSVREKCFLSLFVSTLAILSGCSLGLNSSDVRAYKSKEFHYRINSVELASEQALIEVLLPQIVVNFSSKKIRFDSYIDTASRALYKNNLILRLRLFETKTDSMKLTLKSRASKLGDLVNFKCSKAEIDISGDDSAYSCSKDIEIDLGRSNSQTIFIQAIIAQLQKLHPELLGIIESKLDHGLDELEMTPFAKVVQYDGKFSYVRGKEAPLEVEIWRALSPPTLPVIEISLKGRDSSEVDLIANELVKVLSKKQLIVKGKFDSKTSLSLQQKSLTKLEYPF